MNKDLCTSLIMRINKVNREIEKLQSGHERIRVYFREETISACARNKITARLWIWGFRYELSRSSASFMRLKEQAISVERGEAELIADEDMPPKLAMELRDKRQSINARFKEMEAHRVAFLAGAEALVGQFHRAVSRVGAEGEIVRLYSYIPGWKLRKLAEFLFSPKVFREILEPTLRDLFDEYCKALEEARPWKARWVRIRGYWSFWSAVFAQLPISAVKMVYKIWQATR